MAVDIENTEAGLYWAQSKSGRWMIVEVDRRANRLWPVYPWHERYRYTLVTDQFTLGEKIEAPGELWCD